MKILRRIAHAIKALALVALVFLCAFFALCLIHSPAFAMGEGYELYFGTSSSLMKETDSPLLDKLVLSDVAGESVRYKGDRLQEICEHFQGELLFTEEACGVSNYYFYSPRLGGGVSLNGYIVNLHVAVSKEQTAVGTPLIFGGF